MCAPTFSITGNFLECNLNKSTPGHHRFSFCFYSTINMLGAQDEFNMDQRVLKCIFIYLFDLLFNPL
jgi:hypothetical protein